MIRVIFKAIFQASYKESYKQYTIIYVHNVYSSFYKKITAKPKRF